MGMVRNVFVATSLADKYAKCGNMEKARGVFDGMPENDMVTWGAMIQGYALNGLPREAMDLFLQIQRENVKPDCYTVVGVLSACTRLGVLELGEWASGLVDRNEFLCNPIVGTALIELYAKCGSIAQAWEVFKRMKEKDRVVWNAIISGLAMNGYVKISFGLFGQVEKIGIKPDGKLSLPCSVVVLMLVWLMRANNISIAWTVSFLCLQQLSITDVWWIFLVVQVY